MATSADRPVDTRQTTIYRSSEAIRRGDRTPVDLVQSCLAAIDRYEPHVSAWVFVDADSALADAERLTAELRQAQWRGPLHGIPIGVKDIFDVFDWPTAGGSKRWANSYARRDCTVVERLRRAGAIFLGKTVTTQYASFDPSVTRNPWHPDRTPAGSSSGSAAGVACGMCLGALASQTGGSINRPASFCGVPGVKPTFARVSVDGVLPLAPHLDHVGVMARCVRDLAVLLQTIAGFDPRDPGCSRRPVPDFAFVQSETQPVPRLGRVRGLFEERAEPPMQELMDRIIPQLEADGAEIVEIALPAGFAEVVRQHRTIMAVEAATYHQSRLQRYPDDYEPKIRALIEEGLACPAPEYERCRTNQAQLRRETMACFRGVDALIMPATTGPAPSRDTTGDPAFNSPWSYTGLPTVNLPAGWSADGLPLAIQVVGPAWKEAPLLACAAWVEDSLALEPREPPAGGNGRSL